MVWRLPCFGNGTEVVSKTTKTSWCKKIQSNVTLVVRYSTIEEEASEIEVTTRQGHVINHKDDDIERSIVQQATRQVSAELMKRKEMEKYATLLRQRLGESVKEIQKGNESTRCRDEAGDQTKHVTFPNPHATLRERISDRRFKLPQDESRDGDVKLTDNLTREEIIELKQLLRIILQRKIKDEKSKVTAHDPLGLLRKPPLPSRPRTTVERRCKVPSAMKDKSPEGESFNNGYATMVRKRMDQLSAATTSSSVPDDSDDEISLPKKQPNFTPNAGPTNVRLRLFSLGVSTRDMTADWIMRQKFEQYKDVDF